MFRTVFRRYFLSLTFDVVRSGLKMERPCICACARARVCVCVEGCTHLPHCHGIPFPQENNMNSRGRGKGKGRPRTGHEGPEGEERYSSTFSLTSALDGVGGQRHAPATYPRERPGTLFIGGWVGPRASLDRCGKSRPYRNSIPRTVQPIA
jgi:hypothetical protein